MFTFIPKKFLNFEMKKERSKSDEAQFKGNKC